MRPRSCRRPRRSTARPGRGRLEVDCPDPTALIIVDDQERNVRGNGTCTLKLNLVPGIYRIRLLPAEGRPTEEHAEVIEGSLTRLTLKAPEARLGSDQIEMLGALDLAPSEDGYLRAAEELDPIASPRLGSLLGLAAFAAQAAAGTDGFDRLRKVGVRDFSGLAPGRAGLLVIIGAGGDEPVPGLPRDRFLADTELIARDLEGLAVHRGKLELLAALPTAAQSSAELEPGCITAELRVPGLAPTRYALTALPDRVTVLIAVAEDNGGVDVQQYLVPARPDALVHGGDYLQDPRNIRRLEQAQRYYARLPRLQSFDEQLQLIEQELHVQDLLAGKWLDPLLGALAGYALVRGGEPERYAGSPVPNGTGMQQSAMLEHAEPLRRAARRARARRALRARAPRRALRRRARARAAGLRRGLPRALRLARRVAAAGAAAALAGAERAARRLPVDRLGGRAAGARRPRRPLRRRRRSTGRCWSRSARRSSRRCGRCAGSSTASAGRSARASRSPRASCWRCSSSSPTAPTGSRRASPTTPRPAASRSRSRRSRPCSTAPGRSRWCC